ncbi:MAG: hypothetical protein ISP93_00770 [SAR86 cluster bacterium]|nr:hypothetical protein [SAR86 cluster bacterium]MBL6810654.1 hypothetical protein [SAR86 cluster bacterium]
MVKEFLIWPIRIFLYLVAIAIIIFYSIALFISTSYGTEKIKEYFFDDSLTYQSAKVEPSLLGVSVKLENFSYSSAVLFEGEEIELELNLLNSVISQRLHLEMLAFKNGEVTSNENFESNQENSSDIFIKELLIRNLKLGNTSFENINLDNFLSQSGKFGFNFSDLNIQLPGSLKSITNLEGFGLFKSDKLNLQIRSDSSQLELSFLEELALLDFFEGFITLNFSDGFSIDKGIFRSSGKDISTKINLEYEDDFQINLNINATSDKLMKLIPKTAVQVSNFLEKNSFYSPEANVLINFSSVDQFDNYSLIMSTQNSEIKFNNLQFISPSSNIYADNARLIIYGNELKANDTLLSDYIISSNQFNQGTYNFFTNLPNKIPLNFSINSDGELTSVNGLFKDEENFFKVTLSNQKLFFGISDVGIEVDFISNLSFQGGVFRIAPKDFKSNIFSLNAGSVNFFDFDLNSMSIRNINLDLALKERPSQTVDFTNLNYEDLKIKASDGYLSFRDIASYGAQLTLSGKNLSYNDSSFNIPALRVLSLIDIQSNLTNFLSADFERLNQDSFVVDNFDGELYFDSEGYVNIKEINLNFDVGDAKINGIITSDLEEFDTFNLDLDFFSTISENIPWYVAIIGGIPAAAGAVVVTDILEEDLIQISKSSYKINGNIDNLAITPREQ